MSDFHTFDYAQKLHYHTILSDAANKFGGTNFFLQLIEAVRETKPHPLIAANRVFDSNIAVVKWNKVIFNDKLQLLQKARQQENTQNNLLPDSEAKQYKKVLNLVRTLKPIVFTVTPKHGEAGQGLIFQPFERIDDETTRLHPLFDSLFFSSIETVKKAIAYTPKSDDV